MACGGALILTRTVPHAGLSNACCRAIADVRLSLDTAAMLPSQAKMPTNRKRSSLLNQQATLERSLCDMLAGKGISHLSEQEVEQIINGLRNRLTDVRLALADKDPEPAS
jgi:hypothetical protein